MGSALSSRLEIHACVKREHGGRGKYSRLCAGQIFSCGLYNPSVATYSSIEGGVRLKEAQPVVELWEPSQGCAVPTWKR